MAAMHNPLEQFEVVPLLPLPTFFGIDFTITNSALWMLVAIMLTSLFYITAMRKRAMVPGRLQSIAEMTYEFVDQIVDENTHHQGKKFLPFFLTLFLFIMFVNLCGMLPYAFTPTSHIIVTFGLAAFVFIAITLIALVRKGPIGFLKQFIPPGLPVWMGPLLLVIEFVSYLVRPFSLAIRLAANMFAGHTLMGVIASFVLPLGLFGVLPGVFLVGLMGLEIFVAILQAYVFVLLSSIYLGEALTDHH
jgi:F-type H+-transporting ATPase subunit a